MSARRSLPVVPVNSTLQTLRTGAACLTAAICPCARFSFASGSLNPALGGGWCPGWPQATPKGPQGLDTSRSQRTLSRLEAKAPALANHPAQAGTEHSTPALSPGQADPAAQHPIQALGPSPATHATGT